jgi:hypothetical protein
MEMRENFSHFIACQHYREAHGLFRAFDAIEPTDLLLL